MSLNTKAKAAESIQQRPTSSRRKTASANSSAAQEEAKEIESNAANPVESAKEIALEKIAAAKSEQLKFILDDINSKIISSSSQL